KALKQQGFTDAEVRDDLRARLISQAIVKRLTQNLKVTTTEVETYYEQHTPQFSTPQTRVVRHILVKTKSLADKLYKQVKGGLDSHDAAQSEEAAGERELDEAVHGLPQEGHEVRAGLPAADLVERRLAKPA